VCAKLVMLEPVEIGIDATRCYKCGRPAQRVEGCSLIYCVCGTPLDDKYPVQADVFESPQQKVQCKEN
jgi:hypothetical protein